MQEIILLRGVRIQRGSFVRLIHDSVGRFVATRLQLASAACLSRCATLRIHLRILLCSLRSLRGSVVRGLLDPLG